MIIFSYFSANWIIKMRKLSLIVIAFTLATVAAQFNTPLFFPQVGAGGGDGRLTGYLIWNQHIYLIQLIKHPIESGIFCLFTFWLFFPDKILNQYQNTPQNANITRHIRKKKAFCNTLNWGNWNSGFVKWGVRWAEPIMSPPD